ncbi:hypothetical protein RND71_022907 [Anisodus tanguticus]|uniref:Bidirectional sugar transporter SWEET n=1 Tax=Anisodus tanguticus TaxID=243964 RepID=A0AAE1RTS9_9SOLA|nr:hypothetical protein RND71_022907 [Anisodus tanguticus]
MALFNTSQLAFAFGILGNVVSFLVYLSPLPTFYRIYKRKSTEEFQSVPYSVSLFSAMLYLYYAYLKENGILLITINSFGTAIELIYLTIFLIYATRKSKIYTTKLLLLFNIGSFGAIIGLTHIIAKHQLRLSIVGWICAVFSVSVFAAPLSIMTPNILGFAFGIAQMILYVIYRNRKQQVLPNVNLNDLKEVAIDMKVVVVEIQENGDDKNKQEVVLTTSTI